MHRADIDKVLANGVSGHTQGESGEHVKTEVDGTTVGNCVEKRGPSHHQTGKREVANRMLRLLHKLANSSVWLRCNNAATAGLIYFVDAQGNVFAAGAVENEHLFQVHSGQNVRIENPEVALAGHP